MELQDKYIDYNGEKYILADEKVDDTGVRIIIFKCVDDLLKWFGSAEKKSE